MVKQRNTRPWVKDRPVSLLVIRVDGGGEADCGGGLGKSNKIDRIVLLFIS